MKKVLMTGFIALCSAFLLNANAQNTVVLKITKNYLNLPVSQQEERAQMTFSLVETAKKAKALPIKERTFVIRLSENPEYWVFADVSAYKGKTLQIAYEGNAAGLAKIYEADEFVGQSEIYREANRPQLHFTTQRGWINDPNGLLFYEGEYHLFYQHNPYEREWENMHWGHAVSADLLHWKELPIALFPDQHGAMFSGTAVIDYQNTSGFGTKDSPAMVAFYTADSPAKEVQCLAYSLDKGRTWTKYAGNPVIDSGEKWQSHDTRDPKVFWHEPIKKWVMALNERDGHSIYNSPDMKTWEFQSHTTGFWECPELFELAIDGDKSNTLWVMYGASGTYMLGSFDGYKFTPKTGKFAYGFGAIYAAQTYNNMPDGRRIQVGWDRIENPGMPFKGQMSLPTELTLRNTKNGVRLYNNPIKEIDGLQKEKVISEKNISPEKANELLRQYGNVSPLRIKAKIKISHATFVALALNGWNLIDYNWNFQTINGFYYSPTDFTSMELSADIFIDKTSIQTFLNDGEFSYCLQKEIQNSDGFRFRSDRDFEVTSLEVFTMKSIWE